MKQVLGFRICLSAAAERPPSEDSPFRRRSRPTRSVFLFLRHAPSSELILHRELHDARIVRGQDAPEVRAAQRRRSGCPSRNQLNALNASTRASIRCVSTNRNDRTSDRSTTRLPGPIVGVAARVAVGAERRLRERRRIEPVVQRLVAVRIVEHLVRALRRRLDAGRAPGRGRW